MIWDFVNATLTSYTPKPTLDNRGGRTTGDAISTTIRAIVDKPSRAQRISDNAIGKEVTLVMYVRLSDLRKANNGQGIDIQSGGTVTFTRDAGTTATQAEETMRIESWGIREKRGVVDETTSHVELFLQELP